MWLFATTCFVRIRPGQVGVRQTDWGSERGIDGRDFGPGIYFTTPARTWHRLDARTELVCWAFAREGGDGELLEVRTQEGNSAQIAVSVPWRVKTGEAHAIIAEGSKHVYSARVETTVEKVLLQEFSRMTSSDYEDPLMRRAAMDRAHVRLEQELSVHHARPLAVQITGVYFPLPYEKGKQEQQLAQQEQRTQAVLAEVKAQGLLNESAALKVEDRRKALTRTLTQEFDQEQLAIERELELQRQANESLAKEIERERELLRAELAAEWEATRIELEVVAVEQKSRQATELEAEIERSLARRRTELVAREDAERGAAQLRAQAQERSTTLAEEQNALAVQGLTAELMAERQSERLLAETSARAIVREGETAAGALLAEASRRSLALQQEGARALELAGIERDGALGELLSTEGGRLYQAREAARALRFGRVTFDPADERVPSPFDLDALQELVLGREP